MYYKVSKDVRLTQLNCLLLQPSDINKIYFHMNQYNMIRTNINVEIQGLLIY